ncbi:MAG: hypothetical protein ACLQVI_14750 [Polyangiaceae bacterium]
MISQSREEVILPYPRPIESLGLAKELRSTLVASSLESLRHRKLLDRYREIVAPAHRDALLSTVAGLWLPMEVGMAHYDAVDRLGFSAEEQAGIGAEVSHKIHDTFLGVVMKMATNAGVTPWTLLPKGNQLYGRLFQGGGGTRVLKLGPKEARADIVGVPILVVPYFRNAIRGLYQAAISVFCTKCYVHEIVRRSEPTAIGLRISWA